MRTVRFVILLLITAVSVPAQGAWTLSFRPDNFDVYTDSATIRRTGNLVRMWHLQNFQAGQKSEQGGSYFSSLIQKEYGSSGNRVGQLWV